MSHACFGFFVLINNLKHQQQTVPLCLCVQIIFSHRGTEARLGAKEVRPLFLILTF
jgi:hypothetical protein